MKLRHILVSACLPLAALVACGGSAENNGDGDGDGDSAPITSSEGKEETCAEFCEQLAECDGVDTSDCAETCAEGSTTSRGGQEVLTECFTTDVCAADVSELEGLQALACVTEGLEDLPVSQAGETFCEETVDAINDCLGGPPPEAAPFGSCETTIGLASDELLEDLNDCVEDDCAAVEQCVNLELLQALPLGALLAAEEGELSPALLSELLALGAVFGQLNLGDETDLFGMTPDGMGGAAN